MKRSGIAPVLLCVLSLFCLPAPALTAQSGDGEAAARAQADAFLHHAEDAFAAGSPARSTALLDSALQLSPDYSECLYLRARIELAERAGTRAAVLDLGSSLRNGSWGRTDPDTVRQVLAGVLLRTGALAEAQGLLEALSARHPEDAENPLLLARLFARVGDKVREQRILSDALARFPLRDEFRLLSAALLEGQGRPKAAQEAVSTGLKVHPDSLPLLLASARLQPGASARRAAADLYISKGGTDPLSAVLALESAAKDQQKYLELFLSQGGLGREDLVRRAASAVHGSPALSRTLAQALSAYSGARDLDPEESGFWVERWTFEKGVVTAWVRDPARDGASQYAAQFVDGAPSTLAYRQPSGDLVTLRYSRYPFIASAEIRSGTWLFPVPYTLQCAFLQVPSEGSAGFSPRIAARIITPTAEQLERGAYRREEYAANGVDILRMTELSHGIPVYREEDSNGDGLMDHRLWYANGVPVRGQRSPTGNGTVPVTETWKDGKLAAVEFDTNNDGTMDYRELFGAKPMKLWDYNADGRMDSREYPGQGGAVIREISSTGNGVFDLRVVWSGGHITQVVKSGSPLNVTADPKRGVTWIGRPAPAGVTVDTARPDGMQLLGGREYLVFHYGGITYAEGVR